MMLIGNILYSQDVEAHPALCLVRSLILKQGIESYSFMRYDSIIIMIAWLITLVRLCVDIFIIISQNMAFKSNI
jgi:hypothetical protein